MSTNGNKSCSGCLRMISSSRFLACSACRQHYDLDCAGVSEQRFFNTLTGEHRAAWKCVACKSKQPKVDNTETPVRDGHGGVTLRRGAPMDLDASLLDRTGRESLDSTAHNVTVEVTDFQAFVLEMRQLQEDVRSELRALRTQMEALRSEMLTLSGRVSHCEGRIGAVEQRAHALEQAAEAAERRRAEGAEGAGAGCVAELERTVAGLREELNGRDQEAPLADLEIGQLPEEKGENPIHAVMVLAGRLGVALEERDVVFAECVGAVGAAGEARGGRARRLVVRLARRHVRDELLRAARVRRTLAAEGGGRVFVNERLTRANRQLFHRVREECRRLQWRYSWTRRGRIFARKGDSAVAHQIRSTDDLEKVFNRPGI